MVDITDVYVLLSSDITNINYSYDNNLLIYKVSNNILNNYIHKINSKNMTKEELTKYNILNYELNDKNIVIPIFNIKFTNLILYLEQYNETYILKNIYNIVLLNLYFKYSNKEIITHMINNIHISNINHNFDITNVFNQRLINHHTITNTYDYMLEIERPLTYVDISSSLINKLTFEDSDFSNDEIFKLISILNEEQKFLLFFHLLINDKYYTNIINNYNILLMMDKCIELYIDLYGYLLRFTWKKLYYDECSNIEITPNKTYIFDINTASILKTINYNHYAPLLNPFIALDIDKKYLDPPRIFGGLYDYSVSENIKKICDLNEFKNNFNIYCTHNSYLNLFENFNFKEYNCYIVGSTLTACIQKNILIKNIFKDKSFENYLNEFYSTSDIDILFIESDKYLFINKASKLINQLKINLCKINQINNISLEIILNKTICLIVSPLFIEQNIDSNINNIINYIHDEKVIQLFEKYYLEINKQFDIEYSTNKYNSNIFNKNMIINTIYKIKIDNNIYYDNNISIKYKIKSKYLLHDIEIFHVNENKIENIISKFHLPCVRCYYDGYNVFLLPSAITAFITYMNLDYKYIASTVSPIDIFMKNKIRGYGLFLNNNEKKCISKHIPIKYSYIKNIFSPIYLNTYLNDFNKNENNNIDKYDIKYINKFNNIKSYYPSTNTSLLLSSRFTKKLNICEINYHKYIENNILKTKIISLTWDLSHL